MTFRPTGLPANRIYTLYATSTIDSGSLTLTENVGRRFRVDVNGALVVAYSTPNPNPLTTNIDTDAIAGLF